MIKPGLFGKTVAADNRRMDFDFCNEQLLYLKKHIDLLFIGDSITQLWNIPAYIGQELFIVNRAIGGDNSTYLSKRFDADCIQLNPKKCILMIGTNDITETEYDHWWHKAGKSREEVIKKYHQNISEIIKKCKIADIDVVLCSVIPSDIAPPYNKELRFDMTAEMNTFQKELAAKNQLAYINYFSALCDIDGHTLRKELTSDGIHPNAKCYEIMARILKEYLYE